MRIKTGFFFSLFLAFCILFTACAPPVSDDIDATPGVPETPPAAQTPQEAQTPEITGQPQGGYTAALNSTGALPLTVTVRAPSDGGILSYQWYRAESETAEGQPVPDAAARTCTPPFDTAGTFYYYAAVTNTLGEDTATVTSDRARIVVDAGLAAYTPGQFGGVENEADSQSITFTFTKAIDALDVNDITVTDGSGSIAKGTETMGTPNSVNWVLPVTVHSAGTVTVSLAKDGVENAPQEVRVYKSGQPSGEEEAEEEPEEPEGPPGLAGTSWAWSGVKLTFKESAVTMTGMGKPYAYTFNGTERTGSIETLGDFTVDQDFLRLTFENFNNLGGDPKVFDNQSAALTGTSWRFGRRVVGVGIVETVEAGFCA